jgi:cytoskeletal protein CcmA (bactofilin family)
MFAKPPTKGAPDGPEPRRPAVASLVAEGVALKGDVSTAGDLHLDGALEGDLKAGRLTIGETGKVTGAIEAEAVEVRGCVRGAICARQVRLCATARVDGDIVHAELVIEPGARFEGRSQVMAAEAPALSVAAE